MNTNSTAHRVAAGGLFCLLLNGLCLAQAPQNLQPIRPQDYEAVEKPKLPPPSGGPAELPEPKVNLPDSEEVLVEEWLGVRFVAAQSDLQASASTRGVEFVGLALLDNADFRSRVEPALGGPITWKAISDVVKTTILYYRSHDRPVVDVIVPEQEITGGVVQLLVIEGRVGTVDVKGNNWFSDRLIREKISLKQGDRIRASKLLQEIDFINSNPFRYVRPVLSPGEELGETNLTLQTTDRLPVRFYAGYENTGSRLTRLGRYLAGVNLGNLWGLGHEAGYQFATNDHFSDIQVHSMYYRIPFNWGHKLAFFGSLACYDARHVFEDLTGCSWQASIRYIMPLPVLLNGKYQHEIELGFDFKRANNDLEYGGIKIYDGTVDTTQWVAQYAGSMEDPLGSTSFTLRGYWSPCMLSSKEQKQDYEKVRAGADPQYLYANLSLERIWNLPLGATFVNRFIGQLSNARLLGSEQLGLGGYNTIRGFDQREVNADQGVIVSLELRSPYITLFKIAGKEQLANKVQFLTFWDYGNAQNRSDWPGDIKSEHLQSVGVGLRYKLGNYLSFRMDYGWRLSNPHDTDFNDPGRFHFGILAAY